MNPQDTILIVFVLELLFKSAYVSHTLLMDSKPVRVYQQDSGCPAESKGSGRMPSVLAKSPQDHGTLSTGEF